MKNFNIHTIPLAAALCISLLFSCTTTIEFPQQPADANSTSQTWSYCVFDSEETCLRGLINSCPPGGVPSDNCLYNGSNSPFGTGGSSSSGEIQESFVYCFYPETRQCFQGPYSACPLDGILSNYCPYSSSSSLQNGGSSSSSSSRGSNISSSSGRASSSSVTPSTNKGGPVSYYGRLKASGNKIVGSKTGSTAVQVRGVSLYWSNTGWSRGTAEKFFAASTINAMADDWKAEIIRVPMGHSIPNKPQYDGSYLDDKYGNMMRVKAAVDAAIAKDVYVIIDWHSHNAHLDMPSSTEFFTAMAQEYGKYDNVIFEIYNEPICSDGGVDWCPNKNTAWTSWAQIKTYAENIISVIRGNGGASSLILVGTPQYSARPIAANGNYLTDDNVGYVFHFYAASHKLGSGEDTGDWDINFSNTSYQAGIERVLNAGKLVFVSEYGTVDASGDGGHDATSSDAWHSFMDTKKISSCAWNLSDVYEGSAFFGTGSTFNMSNWTNTSSMTASGKYIFNKLRAYANSASWRNGSIVVTPSSSSGGGGSSNLYCDFGSRTTNGGGCFQIDDASDCAIIDGGILATRCGRTDLMYCDWGKRHLASSSLECGSTYCGGCYIRNDTSSCIQDSGTPVTECPASSL